MRIPDGAGLGIDIDVQEIAARPYQARDLRHYVGTLTDIRPPDAQSYFGDQDS